jgi:HEAT repeat protein
MTTALMHQAYRAVSCHTVVHLFWSKVLIYPLALSSVIEYNKGKRGTELAMICILPHRCQKMGVDFAFSGYAMSTETDDLKELLQELREESGALPFSRLYGLSDLSAQKLADFRTMWDAFPAAQRRRLVHALAELAEASFQVNFDAIFRHCLDDADDEVRATAIDGLWENEDVALIGPMLSKLRTDPSIRVRAAAATGLGRYVLAGELEQLAPPIQTRIMTELLTTIHSADESTPVRRRAIESVAYASTPDVLAALEIAYYDEDEAMRLSAIVGMGRSCDQQWKNIILTELESASAAMRYEAALACGGLALRDAVPALVRQLDDADRQIRDAAIWSLGQIGGDQAKQALLAAYEDADEDTRAILDEALAEQALLEGDLDFPLYELDEDQVADPLNEELPFLWTDDDQEDLEDEWET